MPGQRDGGAGVKPERHLRHAADHDRAGRGRPRARGERALLLLRAQASRRR